VAQVQATIENVPQNPGTAFTVSGNTITFDGAPPSGTNNIYVYYTSPITQVIQPGQGTVFPNTLSTGGPFWNTSGDVGIGTTTPIAKLHVVGAANSSSALIRVGANGTGGIVWRNASDTSVGYVQINSDGVEYRTTNGGSSVFMTRSGVSFPATQVASADANTLDDYEEGTWTPDLRDGSVSRSPTYEFRSATYVKIGKVVFLRWGFKLSNKGAGSGSGEIRIYGMPFTSIACGSYQEPNVPVGTGLLSTASFAGIARMVVQDSSTYLFGRIVNNADTVWTYNELSNGSWIIGEIFYEVP
jgi:hypothetical protein